jgi:hypothetical protein
MVGPTMFDAELRELGRQFEAAVAEYDAVSERLGVAVEPVYEATASPCMV